MEKKEVLRSLFNLQQQFKIGKESYNSYGKFFFRNFEDLMGKLKPYLENEECILTVSHEPVEIAGQAYIKGVVTLTSIKDGSEYSTTATVMDGDKRQRNELCNAQVSGGTLSYLSKYLTCFLLGISNEKDPDSFENGNNQTVAIPSAPARQQTKQEKVAAMIAEAAACESIEALKAFWKRIGNWQKEAAINAAVVNRRHELEGTKQ